MKAVLPWGWVERAIASVLFVGLCVWTVVIFAAGVFAVVLTLDSLRGMWR